MCSLAACWAVGPAHVLPDSAFCRPWYWDYRTLPSLLTCFTSFLKNDGTFCLLQSEIHGLTSEMMRPTDLHPEGADQQTDLETRAGRRLGLRSPGTAWIPRSFTGMWVCLFSDSVLLVQCRMRSSMSGSFQLTFCIWLSSELPRVEELWFLRPRAVLVCMCTCETPKDRVDSGMGSCK